MPKYYEFKIAGYYLYFTSYCVIECMHVHVSDRKLTESGSAKFFVKDNGDTVLQNRGILNDREIRKIQEFIKQNYQEMYLKWSEYSIESYYGQKELDDNEIKNRQFRSACFVYRICPLPWTMYLYVVNSSSPIGPLSMKLLCGDTNFTA